MATKNKSKSKSRKPARKPAPKRTSAKSKTKRTSAAKSKTKPASLRGKAAKAKQPAPRRKSPLRKATPRPNVEPTVSYLLTEDSVSVTFPHKKGGKTSMRTKTLRNGTPSFERAIAAIRSKDMPGLIDAMAHAEIVVQRNIDRFPERGVTLENGGVYIDGKALPPELSKRIVAYAEQELPYDSLIKFWRKLAKNPSYRAVQGLFRFLAKNHFPITEDGNFLAYKGVNPDWTDCHSGTFDNRPGMTPSMDRNEVDEDPAQACSKGLHVASHHYAHVNYATPSGGHTIVVSVDPKDVVAVPYHDSDEKMRVCRYVVLAESTGELTDERVHEDDIRQPTPSLPDANAANDTDDAMGPVNEPEDEEEEDESDSDEDEEEDYNEDHPDY